MVGCDRWRMQRSFLIAAPLAAVIVCVPLTVRAESIETGGSQVGAATVIEIWKHNRLMELRQGGGTVRRFHVALGYSPEFNKRIQGDARTPVGHYRVCEKREETQFHRWLGINYPNLDDAERGYVERMISANEWVDIFLTNLRGGMPTASTALGGRLGIHGLGGRRRSGDWTHGCIAVSDEEIEFLYAHVPVGTVVIINE